MNFVWEKVRVLLWKSKSLKLIDRAEKRGESCGGGSRIKWELSFKKRMQPVFI